MPEKEVRAAFFREVAAHIIALRKQLTVVGWKKHLKEFSCETIAEIFVIKLLTGKSTQRQIASRLKINVELPKGRLFWDHFNSAFKRIQEWLPQSDKEKEIWTRWSKHCRGETGDAYEDVIDSALAKYLKEKSKRWENMDRDLRLLRLRISGWTVRQIAEKEELEYSQAKKTIQRVFNRLKLDRATLGISVTNE